MLNVFIGNKPENLVWDVDAAFGSRPLVDDEFTRTVLERIEKATILRGNVFTDRFGAGLYTNCLSTTTKILLSIYYDHEHCFNAIEMGDNGYDLLMSLKEGSVWFDYLDTDCITRDIEWNVNGKVCHNAYDIMQVQEDLL